MATLPDLDTSAVSFLAFWNALDHGVNDIDPDEVLTDGSIDSYTLYDNGVIVQYNGRNGRTFTVRVKEDGWFVAYLDRTEEENDNVRSPSDLSGPYDLINQWAATSVGDIQNNSLERAIQSLQSQLSNVDNITYNASDVGLYDYWHTDATTATVLGASGSGNGSWSHRFSYTSSTTIYGAWATGAGYPYVQTASESYKIDIEWSDTTVVLYADEYGQSNYTNEWHYGAEELWDSGLIPNAATNYGHDVSLSFGETDQIYYGVHTLVTWA